MNLKEYQERATATAQPAAYLHDYLVPMIVGEVGELFGQRAKAVWHRWDGQRLQLELVSEYGDIAWGTAVLLHTLGEHSATYPPLRGQRPTSFGKELAQWHHLHAIAHDLHLFYSQTETLQFMLGGAQQLWQALQAYSEPITGADFDTVLQANLDKLAGRVQRGTLVGSGDHR